MCGVCGVLYKTKNGEKSAPVGVALTAMLAMRGFVSSK